MSKIQKINVGAILIAGCVILGYVILVGSIFIENRHPRNQSNSSINFYIGITLIAVFASISIVIGAAQYNEKNNVGNKRAQLMSSFFTIFGIPIISLIFSILAYTHEKNLPKHMIDRKQSRAERRRNDIISKEKYND